MQNLLNPCETVRLELPDADLTLWPNVDLGTPGSELIRTLIDTIPWRQERIKLFGKSHLQPRLIAWYGDASYRYSGLTLQPLGWTPELLDLKNRVESLTGHRYNSVLLNYYRDQNDSMGLHSDDEPELGAQPAIASLSLGAERVLSLKHKSRKDLKTCKLPLADGSLLLMRGDTQRYWRHGIGKSRRPHGARVNLTFRLIYDPTGSGTK